MTFHCCSPTLTGLPFELVLCICRYGDVRDETRLLSCCSSLARLTSAQSPFAGQLEKIFCGSVCAQLRRALRAAQPQMQQCLDWKLMVGHVRTEELCGTEWTRSWRTRVDKTVAML